VVARPFDDPTPGWLSDYAQIEADIGQMAEFAALLRSEVVDNYGPRAMHVSDELAAELPEPPPSFPELANFARVHRESQLNTSDLVYFYQEATWGLATAASDISARYGEADAFSAARVSEVENALDQTAAARPPSSGA
jgi:hypothetical protein